MLDRKNYFDSNTTNNFTSPSKVEVTVTENRATTTDSLKLLEEMYDKVRQSLIANVKVDYNNIKAECYYFNNSLMSFDSITVYVELNINGESHTYKKNINSRDFGEKAVENINNIGKMLEDYSKGLAVYFILNYATEILFEQLTGQKIPNQLKREKLLK